MTKKNNFIYSVVLVLVSLIINPYIIGLCGQSEKYCIFGSLAHSVGKPMFYLSFVLLILSIVVLLVSDFAFRNWLKFAYVWVPLSVLFMVFSPEYDSSLFPMDRGRVSFFMSTLLLVISLLIIIITYFRNRGSKRA